MTTGTHQQARGDVADRPRPSRRRRSRLVLVVGATVVVSAALVLAVVAAANLLAHGPSKVGPRGYLDGPVDAQGQRIGAHSTPATSTPGPTMSNVSVSTIEQRLPSAWQVKLTPAGDDYDTHFHDPAINAQGYVLATIVAGHPDRVTALVCTFDRPNFSVDAASIKEITACVDAVLPDGQKPAASAWLAANANMPNGGNLAANFGPYRILIFQLKDGYHVQVGAYRASPTP